MSDAEHNDLPENNDAPESDGSPKSDSGPNSSASPEGTDSPGAPGTPGTPSSSETPSPSGTYRPLDLPGSQVHREPMPSVGGEEKSSGEGGASGGSTSREALTGEGSTDEEHPEEEPSEEKDSGKESRGGRPLREPVPDADPGGTWILAEEIPTNIGQPHWALRQRNFFAERRSLLKGSLKAAGSGGVVPSRAFPGREVPGGEAPSGDASSEDASMSIRISRLQEMLLGEALAASCYRTQSDYLRAAATGRDRRASVIAKSGAVLFWTLCHLGEEVGLEEWGRLGSLLRPLLGMGEASLEKAGSGKGSPEGANPEESGLEGADTESAGMEETRAALTLIRRHLLARRLSSGLQASGGPAPGEVLPPAPEEIRKAAREAGRTRPEKERTEEERPGGERPGEAISGEISSEETGLSVCISMRIGEERKKLIRENALQSSYNGMSRYVRHVALGWDRAPSVLAECATIARWVERHLGRPVGQGQWDRLEEMMMEEFGVFLLGSGGQKDVDHVLREGTCHLLGAPLETIIEETGISP